MCNTDCLPQGNGELERHQELLKILIPHRICGPEQGKITKEKNVLHILLLLCKNFMSLKKAVLEGNVCGVHRITEW